MKELCAENIEEHLAYLKDWIAYLRGEEAGGISAEELEKRTKSSQITLDLKGGKNEKTGRA